MARTDISNYKQTSSSHLKLKFTVHVFLRFQTNASSSPILHFCVQYSSKDSKSNGGKGQSSMQFPSVSKYQTAPLSNNANSRTFCLKSPRDWTRWLGAFPPWIGEYRRQSGTTFSEGMDLWNTLPPLEPIWITNSWASMRPSLLWAE